MVLDGWMERTRVGWFDIHKKSLKQNKNLDETDEGWLLPFYCHNTLPEPALKHKPYKVTKYHHTTSRSDKDLRLV